MRNSAFCRLLLVAFAWAPPATCIGAHAKAADSKRVLIIHSFGRDFAPYDAGAEPAPKHTAATPACDRMQAIGQWNTAWDPFYQLDPVWTDEFMVCGAGIYGSGVMSAKEVELLSIALDASYTLWAVAAIMEAEAGAGADP